MAWSYTEGLGNLGIDIAGTTDSVAADVILVVMLIVIIVIVVVVILLSAWIGSRV